MKESETPPQEVNPEQGIPSIPEKKVPFLTSDEEVSPNSPKDPNAEASDSGDAILYLKDTRCPATIIAPYSQKEIQVSEYGHYREKAEKILGYEIGVCLPVDGSQWADPVTYRQTTEHIAPEDEHESKVYAVCDHRFHVLNLPSLEQSERGQFRITYRYNLCSRI